MPKRKNAAELPVELLYEIQLYALSPSLPCVSRRLRDVFSSVSNSFRAQYIIGQIALVAHRGLAAMYTKLLRYPICKQGVLELLQDQLEQYSKPSRIAKAELPRRLFQNLVPKTDTSQWDENDYPLPFLRYLFSLPKIPVIDVNAHDGYALSRSVHARFVPLIRFLLDQGASPSCKRNMAVVIAIRQRDLQIVKVLIEREDKGDKSKETKKSNSKKRKLEDRVELTSDMLKVAVKRNARDIVHYLSMEKGVVPDMQTLQMMVGW
ncbi:hypothetical protein BDQ17DRAFT_1351019 [Cyathus striatus]|nr:hypothetical protein BDQ17DRAFT_1351019 [Cyathus striatus]